MTPAPSPLLVSAKSAAGLCDVSQTTFRKWVDEGIVPKPVRFNGRVLWHYGELKRAIDAMSGIGTDRPGKTWSDVG